MDSNYQKYLEALKKPFRKLTKIEFLQPDGSVAFALDNNEKAGYNQNKSTAFIQDGSLTVTLQNGMRRSASVTLSNVDSAYTYNVNHVWFGRQIRLSMGLVFDDGTEFYLPQGVFYIKNPDEVYQPRQKTVTYHLVDKWAYMDGSLLGELPDTLQVERKDQIPDIRDVMRSLLQLSRDNLESYVYSSKYAVNDTILNFTIPQTGGVSKIVLAGKTTQDSGASVQTPKPLQNVSYGGVEDVFVDIDNTATVNIPSTVELGDKTVNLRFAGIGNAQDTLELDRKNKKATYIQRIGFIASYDEENITTPYLSTTGALTSGATVQYVLETPIRYDVTHTDFTFVLFDYDFPNESCSIQIVNARTPSYLQAEVFDAVPKELQIDSVTPNFTNYYDDKFYTTTDVEGNINQEPMTNLPYTITGSGSIADLILELNATLAGWIGYDQTGTLRLEPSQDDVSDCEKPSLFEFTTRNALLLGLNETVKNADVKNDVKICGTSLNNTVVWGRARNIDPESDTNVNIIGDRIFREERSEYWNPEQCASLARFYLKRKTVLTKSVTIKCQQMFHLYENGVVSVYREDRGRVERHLIQSFTIPLSQKGEMTINAVSVNDLNIKTEITTGGGEA